MGTLGERHVVVGFGVRYLEQIITRIIGPGRKSIRGNATCIHTCHGADSEHNVIPERQSEIWEGLHAMAISVVFHKLKGQPVPAAAPTTGL